MRLDFLLHDLQGGVVNRQVMEYLQHHPARVRRIVGDEYAQHRRLADIEPVAPRIEACTQLLGGIAGTRLEGDFFYDHPRLATHDLHRFGKPFPQHGSAQDIVPVDHRLHSL